eukprot:4381639-Pyramimonas_sp.AAC.1
MFRRAVPCSALAAAISSMRVQFVADRPGVPNGDCAGGVATGVMPLGVCMLCEGLLGICSNRAGSPKMRPN